MIKYRLGKPERSIYIHNYVYNATAHWLGIAAD
jgi:hypothetical protein